MTPSQWHPSAHPGTSLVYHRGTGGWLPKTQAVRDVRRLYDQGLVDLVQRRVSGGFEYVAIKRWRRAKVRLEDSFGFWEERNEY